MAAGKLSISPPGQREVIEAMSAPLGQTSPKPFLFTTYTVAESLGWLRSDLSSFPVMTLLRKAGTKQSAARSNLSTLFCGFTAWCDIAPLTKDVKT
jgi:hypothetical protein